MSNEQIQNEPVGMPDEDLATGPPRPFDEVDDPTEGGRGRDEIADGDEGIPRLGLQDDSPLPGVKADDPAETKDPNLSDEEIARRLEERSDVDSGDGVLPEDRDEVRDGGDTIQPPLHPYHPGR